MRKLFSFFTAVCLTLTLSAQDIVPAVPVYTVAEAVEIGMALADNTSTDSEYTVEGYVINAESFSLMYHNQTWGMADEATAVSSDFKAYHCFPIDNEDTIKVLNGDKVMVVGKIKKYVNTNTQETIIEIEQGDAFFVEKTAGDHTVYEMTAGITVGRALQIGAQLEDNGVSVNQYVISGYISAIKDPFSAIHMNQSFWVTESDNSEAASNAEGAFYVYRGKPETGEALPVGTRVEFITTIKKYVSGTDTVIENADQNIVIRVLTEAPEDIADVVFTSADFLGQGQAATDKTPGGPVFATRDGVTFSCNNAYGEQYSVRCYKDGVVSITSETEQIGKLVFEFVSANGKYYTGGMENEIIVSAQEWTNTMASQARISKVKVYFVEFEKPEGIESVTLTDKVQKILRDGQIYIARDGMLFTIQGTRIR